MDDPGLDVREKLPRYRQAGIEEIWLLDPFTRALRAETLEAGEYRTRVLSAGRLESVVVPGFWLDVAWFWRDRRPPTTACLREIPGSFWAESWRRRSARRRRRDCTRRRRGSRTACGRTRRPAV